MCSYGLTITQSSSKSYVVCRACSQGMALRKPSKLSLFEWITMYTGVTGKIIIKQTTIIGEHHISGVFSEDEAECSNRVF